MTLTVNESELDGAMAAIEQVISEEQRGIGTYQNRSNPFPRLEARRVRSIIVTMCGVSESFARTLIKRLADDKRLVRTGESTATEYTTPLVHDAAIATRVHDRERVDAVIARLVQRGVWSADDKPRSFQVYDSKGAAHSVYSSHDPIRIDWQSVEALLGLTP